MLKISRLADYSIILLQSLLQANGENLSASRLAVKTQLSVHTVSKLLKTLNEAGLLSSERGADGGYRLARSAELISLAQVIAAVDGHLAITECCQDNHQCIHDQACHLKGNWQMINQGIYQVLANLSLADMAKPLVMEQVVTPLVNTLSLVVPPIKERRAKEKELKETHYAN